ncbi:hypothetical protein BKA24_000823 [Microbacterium marinum]|uniref:Uncharacterized protein n=1 Tax=Microbacterium marinum TaxID=421115 RepID=A0A7W7FK85_9MICO|nr:hypothetical protein [Microbacterium marinum]MBB4666114.1 hypothetical protein [Microbacterium marinum]
MLLVWITCGSLPLSLALGAWHEGLAWRIEIGELFEPSDISWAGALG